MKKLLSLFLIAFCIPPTGLPQVVSWKNYSSMFNINGLTISGGHVWAATNGGVFSLNIVDRTFATYTTTEGLSSIIATAIAADSGFVYVGEQAGFIDEIDSTGKVVRTQKDIAQSSAIQKSINSLSFSGDTIFISTAFGVVVVSRSTFNVINSYTHFVSNQTNTPAKSTLPFLDKLYVGSSFGLSVAPRSGTNLAAPDLWKTIDTLSLSSGVTSLALFGGKLFVGTNSGLISTDDGVVFKYVQNIQGDQIISMYAANKFLFVLGKLGIYKISQSGNLAVFPPMTSANAAVLYNDSLGIVGTSSGITLMGSTSIQLKPPGPATNVISQLSVDENGDLWCSTSSNDVGTAFMRFDGKNWTNYSKGNLPGLNTNAFYRVSAICGSRVVFGSWGYGMALFSNDTVITFNRANSLLVGEPNDVNYVLVGNVVCDPAGNIWITNPLAYNGNELAVYRPSDSTWMTFQNPFAPPSGYATIAIDAYGGVWLGDGFGDKGGDYHGVFYYNANGTLSNRSDDRAFAITQNNGLLSNQVNAVLVDKEDQVWLGTSLGLNVIYDPSSPSYMTSIFSMLDQNINAIDYDALDRKWVATNTGVYVLSRDGNTEVTHYDITNSPLLSNTVKSVACDRKNGIVYFATDYGVSSLRTGVLEPVQTFTSLKIFPNPARLPMSTPITISGLVENSQIKIFTVDGKLVADFAAQGGKVAYWNGTDMNGNLLPSGVYVVTAYSTENGETVVGKVAVIRSN